MPTGVYTRTKETKEKMAKLMRKEWLSGKSRLPSRNGCIPWNKGKKIHPNALAALKIANTGRTQSKETIEKRVSKIRGRKHTEEYKLRMSGKNSVHWKGSSTENQLVRSSFAYKQWRKSVFERDNYTCVICGDRNNKDRGKSVKLHADHIKPFAYHIELRFDITNGRTLCIPCHKKTDTYGGKCVKYKI